MNPIHAVGGQLVIERSDRDPARQQDPYASRRRKRRQPGERHGADDGRAAHGDADPPRATDDLGPAEPPVIGTRLDVRA